MSEVERYDSDEEGMLSEFSGYKDIEGHWVKASDYDALAAQCDEGLAREAELRKELEDLKEIKAYATLPLRERCDQRKAFQQRLAVAERLLKNAADYMETSESPRVRFWKIGILSFLASPDCADGEKP